MFACLSAGVNIISSCVTAAAVLCPSCHDGCNSTTCGVMWHTASNVILLT